MNEIKEIFKSENISFSKMEMMNSIPLSNSSITVTIFIIRMIKKRNWLSTELTSDFNKCLDILLDQFCDNSILITTGLERYFSVGLDLPNWSHDLTDLIRLHYFPLMARIIDLPLPLVAIINGHAIAGGMILSMIHDYRYYEFDLFNDLTVATNEIENKSYNQNLNDNHNNNQSHNYSQNQNLNDKQINQKNEKNEKKISNVKANIDPIMAMNEIELPAWIPSPMLSVLKIKMGKDPQLLRECIMNGRKIHQKEALESGIVDGKMFKIRQVYSILKNKNQGMALSYIRREWMKEAYELFKNPQDIKYILRPNMSKL